VDRWGDVRLCNYQGDTIRGTMDTDGYGRLRDQDGNTWRVLHPGGTIVFDLHPLGLRRQGGTG